MIDQFLLTLWAVVAGLAYYDFAKFLWRNGKKVSTARSAAEEKGAGLSAMGTQPSLKGRK